DPSREEHTDGYVRDEPPRDRRVEPLDEAFAGFLRAAVEPLRRGKLPVTVEPETRCVEDREVRRGELEDVPVDAAGRRHVFDGEVLGERLRIELARNAAVDREGFQLAREHTSGRPPR